MTNLAAALETALQNEVNKMNTQERVSITVTVKMEKEKEPIEKTKRAQRAANGCLKDSKNK